MLRSIRQIVRIRKCLTVPLFNLTTATTATGALRVVKQASLHTSSVSYKYDKKSSRKSDDIDSDDEEDDEFKDERDSKVVKTKVNSLRADLILKSGLGMARK